MTKGLASTSLLLLLLTFGIKSQQLYGCQFAFPAACEIRSPIPSSPSYHEFLTLHMASSASIPNKIGTIVTPRASRSRAKLFHPSPHPHTMARSWSPKALGNIGTRAFSTSLCQRILSPHMSFTARSEFQSWCWWIYVLSTRPCLEIVHTGNIDSSSPHSAKTLELSVWLVHAAMRFVTWLSQGSHMTQDWMRTSLPNNMQTKWQGSGIGRLLLMSRTSSLFDYNQLCRGDGAERSLPIYQIEGYRFLRLHLSRGVTV